MMNRVRSGWPIYASVEAARLCDWLEAEPRQIKQVQAQLGQSTGKQASRQTVRRIIKKNLSLETVPTAG